MKFQGAVIKEQGVTFGIIIVKPYVLQNQKERESVVLLGKKAFGAIPIVLMAQNSRGVPTYWGRTDIVKFLSKIPMECIPWREYTFS